MCVNLFFDGLSIGDLLTFKTGPPCILIAKETPDTILRAVRSLNMNNMTKVKAGDTYTEEIPLHQEASDTVTVLAHFCSIL